MTGAACNLCLLCGGDQRDLHAVSDAKDGKPLDIASCRSCGMVQLAQVPDDEALSAFYATEYREAYRGSATPKTRNVHKAGANAAARLAHLMPFVAPGARLLDIGAGGGEFVYLSQAAGLTASGIDPNGTYVAYAREHLQIDLTCAEVADLPQGSKYDVISMFHVLEHLAHPRDVMAQMAALLTDDGLLVIEVPNLGSPRQPPANTFFKAHITYFTEPTLLMLASEWFTPEVRIADKALYMVFRRRSSIAPQQTDLRSQASDLARDRFARRGMMEYILHGGATSVFKRILQIVQTRRAIAGQTPRAILDTFVRSR